MSDSVILMSHQHSLTSAAKVLFTPNFTFLTRLYALSCTKRRASRVGGSIRKRVRPFSFQLGECQARDDLFLDGLHLTCLISAHSCAHQVCNASDCIKIAIDFVSLENIERCWKGAPSQ